MLVALVHMVILKRMREMRNGRRLSFLQIQLTRHLFLPVFQRYKVGEDQQMSSEMYVDSQLNFTRKKAIMI